MIIYANKNTQTLTILKFLCYNDCKNNQKRILVRMSINKKISIIKQKCQLIEDIMISQTCCFTGHRCEKMPWKYNENDEKCIQMKEEIRKQIINAISKGYKYFITGMALGFDIICAEIVLKLKKVYPEIKLIGALPCLNQEIRWSKSYKKRYKKLLKNLDYIWCKNVEYTTRCFFERNDYMVLNSSMIISYYTGGSGGTAYTLKKAAKLGLKIVLIKIN